VDRQRAGFTGTKFGGGESEGGAGISFPQTPFLPALPERWFSATQSAAINQNFFSKKV